MLLDEKSSQKYYGQSSQVSILGPTIFLLYINDLSDYLICTLSVIRHLICGNNYNCFLNLNLIYETLWNGAGCCLLISILRKLNWLHAIDVKMDGSVLDEKSSSKMLGLTFSSKLDFYIMLLHYLYC